MNKWVCVKPFRKIPEGAIVEIQFYDGRILPITTIYVTYNGMTTVTGWNEFRKHFKEESK